MRNNAKAAPLKHHEESGTHALYIAQSPKPSHDSSMPQRPKYSSGLPSPGSPFSQAVDGPPKQANP